MFEREAAWAESVFGVSNFKAYLYACNVVENRYTYRQRSPHVTPKN